MTDMHAEQGVYMTDYRYFGVHARWFQREATPTWSLSVDNDGAHQFERPARFIGSGPIDMFLLHDILKVMDARLESLLISHLGLQTDLGDVIPFKAPAEPRG